MLKKKNLIKKMSVLLAAVIAAMSLVGCGGSGTEDSGYEAETTEETNTAAETDTAADTGDAGNTSIAGMLETMQNNEDMPFVITEKADAMLKEHEELFQADTQKDLDGFTDYSLEYKILAKNIDNYGDKLVCIPEAYVISIWETPLDDTTTFTEMQISDSEGNSYYVLAFMPFDDIYEGDTVKCYGLPLGDTSFDNVSGGTTLAVVLAGSSVEKIYE